MKIQTSRHFLAKLAARRASRILSCAIFLSAAFSVIPRTHAASGTWNGTTDSLWATDTNWSSGAHPVTGDTATFSNSAATVNNRTTIDLSTGQAAAAVTFDTTSATAYTIGAGAVNSQTLTLDNTGAVTLGLAVASAPTTNQLFNSSVVLGTAAVGTTTVTNNATAASLVTLTFAGTVTGGTGGTAGIKTLNTAGTGAVIFTNALGAGGSTQLNLIETGAGTTTLSGNVTSTLNTLRASNLSGSIVVDGQTVTVAAASNYGASGTNQVGKFTLNTGSVAFNGGLFSNANSSVGSLFRVNAGTFTASAVSMNTTGANAADTATTAAPSTTGFVVTGGTATITGALGINGNTNAATALVSGGSLTVGGDTNVGNSASSTRFFRFQVSGGAFNAAGIFLSNNTTLANNSALLLTGGTTTADSINFGRATSTAGSTGTVTLNGGALYVGAGGMVLGSGNAYTTTINLTAGTLGAKADWSSSLPMTLNGAAGTSVTGRGFGSTDWLLVILVNKQAQSQGMHSLAFGERKRLAHEAAQTLAQGAKEAFGVVGLPLGLAAQTMRALGKGFLVGQPEVAAGGPAAVVGREALAQGLGAVSGTISHEEGNDLAGLAAKGDPHPAHVGFGADEAPKLVQLQHVAGLGRQQRLA